MRELRIDERTPQKYMRAAAADPGGTRVVFAAIDQVWCIDRSGKQLWGVQLPPKEGWTRVVESVDSASPSAGVQHALDELGIKLPIQWDTIRKRYKELARQRHPDFNPGQPEAGERMRALNEAYEVLTGASAEGLLADLRNESGFFQQVHSQHESEIDVLGYKIKITINTSTQVSEAYARDWISAVKVSDDGTRIYVASQSGRLFEFDPTGKVGRVYAVGQCINFLEEVRGQVYVGTDTRLYILADGQLVGLEDILDLGRVIATTNGVLLWDDKALKWLSRDGRPVAEILTRDPVRRVTCSAGGWTVQTRQHQAVIHGPPNWWSESEAASG